MSIPFVLLWEQVNGRPKMATMPREKYLEHFAENKAPISLRNPNDTRQHVQLQTEYIYIRSGWCRRNDIIKTSLMPAATCTNPNFVVVKVTGVGDDIDIP